MKSKYLVILSSLIILMLSLSVVSAAIAEGDDNIDNTIDDKSDVKKVGDGKSVSREKVIDEEEKVASNNDKTGKTVDKVKSEESDDSKVKVVLSASYSNKEIIAKVVDKATNKPLANVNVELAVHSDSTGKLVKLTNLKTNSKGYATFSVSDLKADSYSAALVVDDEKYDSNVKDVDFTIKGESNKAYITASYSNKQITAKVVDKATNKPLANANVEMEVHADSARGLVKIANAKTNSKGYATFSVSGLKADNYQSYLSVVDKKYESNLKEVDFTIKKQPVNPTKKVKKNKPKKTNPVDMRNTGIPILGLVLVVFAIFGVGYRKY